MRRATRDFSALPVQSRRVGNDRVTTPFYFLHVRKCAGTTMRHILENAFPAAQMMAAYHQIYYEHELAALSRRIDRAIAITKGISAGGCPRWCRPGIGRSLPSCASQLTG
jgi:hypothetical protein